MSKDKKTFIISVAEYYDKNQKDTKIYRPPLLFSSPHG